MSREGISEVKRLRDLAAWSRGSAKLGDSAERQSRIEWAAILDGLADEEERRAAASQKGTG